MNTSNSTSFELLRALIRGVWLPVVYRGLIRWRLRVVYKEMSDRTRLSPSATDALEILYDPIEQTDGLSREEATTVLVDDGVDSVDADALLDELLSKGYLYAVDDDLYVTPS